MAESDIIKQLVNNITSTLTSMQIIMESNKNALLNLDARFSDVLMPHARNAEAIFADVNNIKTLILKIETNVASVDVILDNIKNLKDLSMSLNRLSNIEDSVSSIKTDIRTMGDTVKPLSKFADFVKKPVNIIAFIIIFVGAMFMVDGLISKTIGAFFTKKTPTVENIYVDKKVEEIRLMIQEINVQKGGGTNENH